MIAINSEKSNDFFKETTIINEKLINNIKNDINLITDFSDILEIVIINELDTDSNESYNILYLIKMYEQLLDINMYFEYNCPLCKNKNCLKFKKTYQRDIIFHIGKYEIIAKISLIVVECSICKEEKNCQHYHTIFPDFIFPYHIYSSYIILNTLYDRFINNILITKIIEQNKISHQLFYKWLRGFKKYLLPSSIILNEKIDINIIIINIINNISLFLYKFYQQYYHPFFLFKSTCVPLAQTL